MFIVRLIFVCCVLAAFQLQAQTANNQLSVWLKIADSISRTNPEDALAFSSDKLKTAIKSGNPALRGQALLLHGIQLRKLNRFDSALSCLLDSNNLLKSKTGSLEYALSLDETGTILDMQGNYNKALDYYEQARQMREDQKDTASLANSYNNLGILYSNLSDFPKARSFYEKSLAMSTQAGDMRAQANARNNIAITYYYEKNYRAALTHYEAALKIRKEINLVLPLVESYHNIADVYLELNEVEKSLEYYKLSKVLLDSVPSAFLQVYNLYGLASVYHRQGDFTQSLLYAMRSLDQAKKLSLLREQNTIILLVSENYKSLKQYEKALAYYELYKQTADSLFNLDKTKAIANLEAKATLEKRESELLQQQKLSQRQRVMLFALAGAALLAFITAVVYNRSRNREKKIRHRLEEQNAEIISQAKELKSTNENKDKLLAIIGHDLRNPIASLKGLLALANAGRLTEAEFASITKNLTYTVDQLYLLVNHLLEWANHQLSGIKSHPQELALHGIAQETMNLLLVIAVKKNIELTNKIPEALTAWGDTNMVKVIIRNLTSNALKYTPAGGRVTIAGTSQDNLAHFFVEDNGIGMDEATLQSLFKSGNSRLGTAGEKGTGLGLKMCAEFAAQMGGTLTVTSTVGSGSKFTCSLPARKP